MKRREGFQFGNSTDIHYRKPQACILPIYAIYLFLSFFLFFLINLSISYLHFECYSLSWFPGKHPPNP